MNSDPTFDPEPLQDLLANAFAVQESGMNAQWLATIVNLQRLIQARDLTLESAMDEIADEAREVANASGTAIGLLKADQLVYAAGSGTAAAYAGRRVMATLSTSAPSDFEAEILRVENADDDERIQAAICRQFGAKSLLILPIHSDGALCGVMQIFFDRPHQFAGPELRVYRVLAGLVGEALLISSQPLPQTLPDEDLMPDENQLLDEDQVIGLLDADRFQPSTPDWSSSPSEAFANQLPPDQPLEALALGALEQESLTGESHLEELPLIAVGDETPNNAVVAEVNLAEQANHPELMNQEGINPERANQAEEAEDKIDEELIDASSHSAIPSLVARLSRPSEDRPTWLQTVGLPIFTRIWDVGVAGAMVVAVVTFVLYRSPSPVGHVPDSSQEKSTLQPDAPAQLETPAQSTQPVSQPSSDDPVLQTANTRHPAPTPKSGSHLASRVRRFGNDVTVHYFTPKSTLVRADAAQTEVRHISDDVTIRYFAPDPQEQPQN